MLEIIILIIIFSIDVLFVSISYSIKNIKIPFNALLMISFICSFSLLISVLFSYSINCFINNTLKNFISFLILFLMGLYNIFQERIKRLFKDSNNKLLNIYFDETKADFNNSQNLNQREAFNLSLILSIDTLFGGFSIGLVYNYILFITILSFIINIVFLELGFFLGKKIKLLNINTSYILGIILIILGILKLF